MKETIPFAEGYDTLFKIIGFSVIIPHALFILAYPKLRRKYDPFLFSLNVWGLVSRSGK